MGDLEDALLRMALWVGLGGVLVAAGSGFFFIVVWGHSRTVARPPSVERAFVRRWRRLVVLSWIVAASSSIPLVLWEGPLGVEGLRLGLVLIAGLMWLVAGRAGWPEGVRRSGLLPKTLGVSALLALLLSAALSGHARGSSLPLPNVLVAVIHVAAAAAWVGGLVALVAVAFPAVREQEESERAAILAPVVARLSDLAVLSVLAIVASGIYSAWMEIRGVEAVTASTYGLVFLAKLAAFAPVLALGGVNNRWTKPRLLKAVREDTPARSPLILLRRLVALEIALIAVVLALTVFLLQLSPPAITGSNS